MNAAKPLLERVVTHIGRLGILVNTAAIAVQRKPVDAPDVDTVNLDRQWAVADQRAGRGNNATRRSR